MSTRLLVVFVSGLALALPGAAAADPPVLQTIDQAARRPTAHFSIPGADFGAIYFATKPDRASGGSFLDENVAYVDQLTDAEIQSGTWTFESQLDPAKYYVLVNAVDLDCFWLPTCLRGYSNVLTLNVPMPTQSYRGSVTVLRYRNVASLTLRVKPQGEVLPYKVCWRLRSGKRRCVAGKVYGSDWNSPAEGSRTVGLRGMPKRTTFTWYVHGRKVASRSANTRRR